MRIHRRTFLLMGTGAVLASTSPSWAQMPHQSRATMKIGYWPTAAALPLYLALEKGYFQQVGLEVEAVKFPGEQQIVEGLIAGQIQGAANGVGSDNLATGEIASPGLFKIIASNTIGGTLNSPWFGGSAALTTQFFRESPAAAKKYVDVYRRAITSLREHPQEARQYLQGYTEIQGERAKAIPLPEYRLYDEFTASEMEYFQKFFDLLPDQPVMTPKLEATSLVLKDLQVA